MDSFLGVSALIAVVLIYNYLRGARKRREAFIQSYRFPTTISQKVKKVYPHLSDAQVKRVIDGLREYFSICNTAGRRMISMPSQVVDLAWHEFILFTRAYRNFCKRGVGRFLHHVPAEAMAAPTLAQDGIKRAWRLACQREGMDPKAAARLPMLFAIDAELGISDGFHYVLDCSEARERDQNSGGGAVYCGSHIGCGGGCGGSSCSSDGGSCGSSCGGGCGGD